MFSDNDIDLYNYITHIGQHLAEKNKEFEKDSNLLYFERIYFTYIIDISLEMVA